jgi:hypothetical protein
MALFLNIIFVAEIWQKDKPYISMYEYWTTIVIGKDKHPPKYRQSAWMHGVSTHVSRPPPSCDKTCEPR